MSWRRTLLAIALVTTTTAPSARASWLVGGDVGVGIPTGTFSDYFASGFVGGISASKLVNPKLAVGIDVSHSSFGATSDYQALLDFLDPGATDDFSVWQYGVHGNWMMPTKSGKGPVPYVALGTGLYSVSDKYESPGVSDELSETAFGFRLGVGLDYWVSPTLGFGIDTNYNDVFTSEDTMGFDNTPYFTLNAGIRWKSAKSK